MEKIKDSSKFNIRVIIPNASEEFRDNNIAERENLSSSDFNLDVVCLEGGPESIESASDDAIAAPYIMQEIIKAEKAGYDGITLDCAMDTSLRAAKEMCSIPIVSAGEASHHIAMLLGDKFSVITVLKETALAIQENINAKEYQSRCSSVRVADIPVLALDDEERARSAILREAKIAIEKDGASVIALGCTGMSKIARKIKEELNIPVIDPAAAAIQVLEILIRMDLTNSELAFPTTDKY